MDPTTVFCPHSVCPARGRVGQGNIRIHSRQEKRFLCTECRKTFAATKGTVFYRLRTSTELVVTVVTLLATASRSAVSNSSSVCVSTA